MTTAQPPALEPPDHVRRWVSAAARAAADKLGTDTVVLEVGHVLSITDAFVITSGSNHRQVRAIAEEVEARVRAAGGPSPFRVEGRDDAQWVLLDFGDFVVHVFSEETRRYYELERLWADAPRWDWGADQLERPGEAEGARAAPG
ncbi:MAG: ribosome silencing factor [Acidimicrobiales bacterium]